MYRNPECFHACTVHLRVCSFIFSNSPQARTNFRNSGWCLLRCKNDNLLQRDREPLHSAYSFYVLATPLYWILEHRMEKSKLSETTCVCWVHIIPWNCNPFPALRGGGSGFLPEQFDTNVTSTALHPTAVTNGREVTANIGTQFHANGHVFRTVSRTGLKTVWIVIKVRAKFPFQNQVIN